MSEIPSYHRRSSPMWRAGPACGVFVSASRNVLDLLAAGASREEILADYSAVGGRGHYRLALNTRARQSDHPVLHVA